MWVCRLAPLTPIRSHKYRKNYHLWACSDLSSEREGLCVCMYVCTCGHKKNRLPWQQSCSRSICFAVFFFFPLYVNANTSSEWDHPSRFFPPPNFNMINIRSPCIFLPAVWQHASIASFNLVSAGSSRWSVSAVCLFHEAETACVFDRVPQAWDVKPWRLSSGYQRPFQKNGFQFG